MLAVKGIYENGKIRLLQEVGNIKKARAYVILIPEEVEDKKTEQRINNTANRTNQDQSESYYLMKMQQQTGYIQALLNDPDEDVWNDL